MLMRTLAATLMLALPAAAQVATPTPGNDRLAPVDTYPGADIELPVAVAPEFRPAVPGCVGVGLPDRGYGDILSCHSVTGRPEPRPGIVTVPID
ncbi:hypothetical protein JQC91_06755 [Jannaschia sp. Os4]|uniref:hypothetical protein n=1 Tax=Jannaschia sp. Os4 TaxID=2807617 RepID=UPI001939A372|nr:hypothetical protein [Jannaschia sp. Os4]MBM2575999.1 hypothetical protein [Jannaschia sp. Os4]